MSELPFVSELLNNDFTALHEKIAETRCNIGILKGACFGLPNPQLLLSPTMMREALESSEIESIVTTLEDALKSQLFEENERSPADKEVNRYHQALLAGIKQMSKTYLGTNTIIKVHDTLVPDEKGVRKVQNQLINSSTKQVVYEPVPPHLIKDYLSDLEKFINRKKDIDPVIKNILVHYQFEKIHPFGDGNGRTGRILLVLCAMDSGLLELPVFFISEYINNHKRKYYKVFREASEPGGIVEFVDYMLEAFNTQAIESTNILLGIKQLHEKAQNHIREKLPKIYSRDLVDAIFNQPIMTASRYRDIMKISYPTAQNHLRHLEGIGYMKSAEAGKYRLYANIELMKFLNGKSNK